MRRTVKRSFKGPFLSQVEAVSRRTGRIAREKGEHASQLTFHGSGGDRRTGKRELQYLWDRSVRAVALLSEHRCLACTKKIC